MTKYEIISELGTNHTVEKLLRKLSKKSFKAESTLQDLCQDIYIALLEKEEDTITGLYERKELDKYIMQMLKNQYLSVTSPYYQKYKRFLNSSQELNPDRY